MCRDWQTFSGFVQLNLQFSVSWLVDFQWVRVAQSLVFCVMVGRLLVGSCGSIFSFLCHGWQTFSGVRVAQSLVFCVMVGRLLVGFVQLNFSFSVSWLVDLQWGSCDSIFSFMCHGWQTFSGVRVAHSLVFFVMVGRLFVGFVWLNLQISVSWLVDFQWGSCGSIFSFLCHGWQTFSGVRVAQSLILCVVICRLLVGSCGSIFRFLCHHWQTFRGVRVAQSLFFCHCWQTFSGVRVAQSLIFCVMVGRFLVGFVWLSLVFCVMFGRLLVRFVWLNLQFSVSWLVEFQWCLCGSVLSFLCHGWQTFSGVGVALSLVFCVMVGRLLVGFVWLNLQFFVSWLVDFQLDSCGSIQFSVSWLLDSQWSSCGSIFSFLSHGRQTFSGVRVAQSLVFCVMVDIFFVGFVWLNLQFSLSQLVDFQWGSCGSIFRFLCHHWQTFSGVRVAQSLFFCVIVGRLLVGFVRLNL